MKRDDMSLGGLLADPMIRMVMRSDGVAEDDILALARSHRARTAGRRYADVTHAKCEAARQAAL